MTGDLIPYSSGGKVIVMVIAFAGYWIHLLTMCVVLLSQLAGEPDPTMLTMLTKIAKKVWPSLAVVVALLLVLGPVFPEVLSNEARESDLGVGDGIYYAWCVAFRMPFGDIYAGSNDMVAKVMTAVLGLVGLMYQPYVLALVALRHPSVEEYQAFILALHAEPLDPTVLGRGYVQPSHEPIESMDHGPAGLAAIIFSLLGGFSTIGGLWTFMEHV